MRVLPITSLLLISLVGLVGCRSILGIEEIDVPPIGCASSADCSAPTPVCLVPAGTCVQCTAEESASCTGGTPVCAADHTCAECRAHADCASQVCLPEGRCADEAQIAYVDGAASPTATMCTRSEPCRQLGQALALAPARPIIKILAGVVVEDSTRSIFDRTVTIVGDPGAVLTRTNPGDYLRVEANARVTIRDLALSNLMGGGNAALYVKDGELTLDRVEISNNAGTAVRVQGNGLLRLTRSRIARNLQGGVSVESLGSSFEVIGNVFLENGSPGTTSGSVQINNAQGPSKRLEHNSFYGNVSGGGGAAIDCDGPLVARNNIVSGAAVGPTTQQLSGNCMHAHSIFYLLSNNVPAGAGNLGVDPQFVDPARGDLHIKAGSPAQAAADPGTLVDALSEIDLDGDRRIAPADIGADEVP